MADQSAWVFSLTREDVLARLAKRDEIVREIEQLQKKLSDEDLWLEALTRILPPELTRGLGVSIGRRSEDAEKSQTWHDVAMFALKPAIKGMLPREIVSYIRDFGTPDIIAKLDGNPNGIYLGLAKLVDDGRIKKVSDKYYTDDLYHRLLRDGALDDDAQSGGSDVRSAFLSIFRGLKSVPPKTVAEILRSNPEMAAKMDANPQYVYSTLARLAKQGHLVKDGAFYSLPSKENEPASVPAPAGSDAETEEDEEEDLLGPDPVSSSHPASR